VTAAKMSGCIEPTVVYPLADFKRRTGFDDTAMRSARRAGLKVIYANNRVFVRGSDFVQYLDRMR